MDRPTKKIKKTSAEIIAGLEKTGIDFSPLGLGPWSHSKLKVLAKCPLKFYLQYIIKQEPKGTPEISVVTESGKAAHRILELTLAGKSIERSYQITKTEFTTATKATLNPEQWSEGIEPLEYNIGKFKERMDEFGSKHGIKHIKQELRIGVTKDWKPTGFFDDDVYFRGVIDLCIKLSNGDLMVIDHKLGTVSAMGVRWAEDQLNTYKVLYLKGVEDIEGAQCGIHHIREGEISLGEYSDREEIETRLLPRLEFAIQGAIDGVLELGYFKHIAHSGCQYCDYRGECKKGELKEQEKATKKWFEIKPVA